ncbi:MAG: chaperonin GroEL [Patescibacteria group bacterium]
MSKIIKFNAEAREKIKSGIDQVADAVKVTLGPRGRNVILDKGFGTPLITNDGVSIAKEIELSDKFENIGAEMIKEVASKTNDVAGDGTTTSTVLTQVLVAEGMKLLASGMNPMNIREGMEKAKTDAIRELKSLSKEIKSKEEIAQVATISAESEEMGNIISEVIYQVGKDGVITVEDSQTFGFSKEIVEGISFDKGYVSPYMITSGETLKSELKDPFFLITDKKISSIQELLPILEKITATGKKEIVIIADEIEGDALTTLVVNKLRGILNVLAVKAPDFGEGKKAILEDIAIITGGKVISEEKGMKLEGVELSMLGKAGKVVSTQNDTTIIDGKGKKKDIETRIAQIRSQMESVSSKWDKEKFQKRLAKLTGGVSIIKVGAATETELNYIKKKMEDALAASRAAVSEGIVAGGGTAFLKASQKLLSQFKTKSQKDATEVEFEGGYMLVAKALEAPIRQIVRNGGKHEEGVVVNEILNNGKDGYDAKKQVFVSDMIKAGIIDPLKVSRTALENAVSVASILLTTEAAITEKPKEENCSCSHGAPQMPMM